MFNNYMKKDMIRSSDWDEYFMYSDKRLFTHERLTYETIQQFMAKAYRRCILVNPSFILRRLIRGFRTGEFFWDAYYAVNFFLMPSVGKSIRSTYYARDRWPEWDFRANPSTPAQYQIVGKNNVAQGAENVE